MGFGTVSPNSTRRLELCSNISKSGKEKKNCWAFYGKMRVTKQFGAVFFFKFNAASNHCSLFIFIMSLGYCYLKKNPFSRGEITVSLPLPFSQCCGRPRDSFWWRTLMPPPSTGTLGCSGLSCSAGTVYTTLKFSFLFFNFVRQVLV